MSGSLRPSSALLPQHLARHLPGPGPWVGAGSQPIPTPRITLLAHGTDACALSLGWATRI